jgi:hypothetical protein
MKKVRLALGAAGIAPALGVAAPAAAAAHAPEGPVANTAPAQGKTVRVDPATGCVGKVATKAHSFSFSIWAYHTQASGCVGGVSGFLGSPVPGLSMRTRIYTISAGGAKTRVFSQYRGGDIKDGQGTFFRQDVHTILGGVKQQVCAALVQAKPHRSNVEYGPVCVSFPS